MPDDLELLRLRAMAKMKFKAEGFKQSKQDLTSVNPSTGDEPSWKQMIFPSAQAKDKRPSINIPSSSGEIMGGLFDLLGVGTRAFGAATGQGDMTDPESNIFSNPRQKMRDWIDSGMKSNKEEALEMRDKYKDGHWTDALPGNSPFKSMLDPRKEGNAHLKALRLVTDMGFEIAGDPTVLLGGMFKGAAKRAAKMDYRGVPQSDLTKGGFKVTPAQAADKATGTGARLEQHAQTNPFTEKIPLDIKEGNIAELQKQINQTSEGIGGQPVETLSGAIRGQKIEDVAEATQDISKKLYGAGEDVITKPISKNPINYTEEKVLVKKGKKPGSLGLKGTPDEFKIVPTNDASKMVERSLSRAGHRVGDKVKNIGAINDKTIKQALKYKDDIADAKTIKDLINTKRNIAQETFDATDLGLFKGDANQSFLKGINATLNKALGNTIEMVVPKESSKNVLNAYNTINKQYSDVIDIMSPITSKLGVGKKTSQAQNVIDKIKLISPKNLRAIKEGGIELKPIYDELSRGGFESIVKKSTNQSTKTVSPDKFLSEWGKLDSELKSALFPKELVSNMDELSDIVRITGRNDLNKLNPSGTAKANFLNNVWSNKIDAIQSMFKYSAVKHYYKTGKLYRESALNLIKKTGEKTENIISDDMMKAILGASSFDAFYNQLRGE